MKKTDYEFWLNMSETKEVLKYVQEEINRHRKDIFDGSCLAKDTADGIATDYAKAVGHLDGLEVFKKAILNYLERENNS